MVRMVVRQEVRKMAYKFTCPVCGAEMEEEDNGELRDNAVHHMEEEHFDEAIQETE